jgi:hypothetical protein
MVRGPVVRGNHGDICFGLFCPLATLRYLRRKRLVQFVDPLMEIISAMPYRKQIGIGIILLSVVLIF